MKRLTGSIPVFLLILAVVTIPAGTAPASVNSGGVLGKFKAVTETSTHSTSSTSYVGIEGMTRTFTTKRRSRLVITFSAEVFAADTDMFVRCRLNGTPVLPDEVRFTGFTSGEGWRVKSDIWITDVLDPGTYTVDMRYRSSVVAEAITILKRTLLIQFKK